MKIKPLYLNGEPSGTALHLNLWRLEVALAWWAGYSPTVTFVKRAKRARQYRIGPIMFGWKWRGK